MPSYVFVWENNTFGHSKVKGRTWPGHSSINISKEFWGGDDAAYQKNYASYWPADGADFGVLGALFSKKQKSDTNWTFEDDIWAEGYLPDHIIEMTTDAEKERKMLAEWISILTKKGGPSYRTFRKNCSTIVSRILHAGGFYGQKWALNNQVAWSPADIKKLAVSAGGTLMTWDAFKDVYTASFLKIEDLTCKKGPVTHARDSALCSTGAPCRFNNGK